MRFGPCWTCKGNFIVYSQNIHILSDRTCMSGNVQTSMSGNGFLYAYFGFVVFGFVGFCCNFGIVCYGAIVGMVMIQIIAFLIGQPIFAVMLN